MTMKSKIVPDPALHPYNSRPGIGVDPKSGLAGRAFLPVRVSLQDRLSFTINACGAKIVKGLSLTAAFSKTIYDRTGWSFAKLITLYVGLKSVRLCQFILKRRKLEFQIRIRELRCCYLHSELAKRSFDLNVCTALRLLEKRLNGLDPFRDFAGGSADLSGDFGRAYQAIEIKVHDLLRLESTLKNLANTADV